MDLNGRAHSYITDKIMDRMFGIRGVMPMNLWDMYGGLRSSFTALMNEIAIYGHGSTTLNPIIPKLEVTRHYTIKPVVISQDFNTLNKSKLNAMLLGKYAYITTDKVPCGLLTLNQNQLK